MKSSHQTGIPTDCVPFEGRPHRYQAKAVEAYYIETAMVPATWEWITPTCRTVMCMNPDHMKFTAPRILKYPSYVCVYCGRSAYTKDHLLPRHQTGAAKRAYVAIVPACGTCNSIIGDTLTWSITERRAICHARLRRKFRRVLNHVEYGATDLAEFGPTLRKAVIEGMELKAEVLAMLGWPSDPHYDMRALQKSGIEDPYAIGLLIDQAEANRIAAEVTAPAKRETLDDARESDRKTRERKRKMQAKIDALSAKIRAEGETA